MALVVLVAVMSIATAIVLPLWSSVIQRERERQLIFRGAQYAEAIRVFQARFGRLPVKLDELLEVEPRSIRQLWKDPMTDNGRWELMRQAGQGGTPGQGGGVPGQAGGGAQGAGAGVTGGAAGAGAGGTGGAAGAQAGSGVGDLFGDRGSGQGSDPFALGGGSGGSDLPGSGRAPDQGPLGTGDGKEVSVGPIAGVHSRSTDSGFRLFLDREQYNRWEFTPALFPPVVGADGKPLTPHLGTDWIGRPPPKVKIEQGETPVDQFRNALEDLAGDDSP